MAAVREVCRPLKDFYPDVDERHRAHYLFAHRFLPAYFFQNPRGVGYHLDQGDQNDCTRYVQARWQMMEEHEAGTSIRGFRRVTDLSAWKQQIGSHPALCVTMPEPEAPPLAFLLAAVFMVPSSMPWDDWPQETTGRFFTLERTDEDEAGYGVLCEWTVTEHRNHVVRAESTAQGFIDAVARELKSK